MKRAAEEHVKQEDVARRIRSKAEVAAFDGSTGRDRDPARGRA